MDIEQHVQDLRSRQERIRPAGTPSQVHYPLGEITLPEHVAHWARRRPDRPAIIFQGREIRYRELDESIRRLAGWLDSAGVRAGDRVAVHLPNSPQFVIAMLAVLRLGAVHVPVNPAFRGAELSHELGDSGSEVVITVDSLLPVLDQVRERSPVRRVLVTAATEMARSGEHPHVDASWGGSLSMWTDALEHPPVDGPAGDLDALAALNYTGGTTGLPKGCEHTQRHMLYTAATSAAATRQTTTTRHVVLCYIPIFWIAGEDLGILNPLVLGGTSILLPRWDPGEVLAAIDGYGVTTMVGTVENYLDLLARPDFGRYEVSSLIDPMAVSFVRKLTPEVRHRWAAAAMEPVMWIPQLSGPEDRIDTMLVCQVRAHVEIAARRCDRGCDGRGDRRGSGLRLAGRQGLRSDSGPADHARHRTDGSDRRCGLGAVARRR